MHDRRVIRGSTYSLRRSIENRLSDMDDQSNKSSKRNVSAKRKVKSKRTRSRIKTPRAVDGRMHMEMQTDPYLEEIHVSKKEQALGTQTDPFLDRPSTPLFVPKLSGKSMATQIEDGDLFDFDREVEPILEVLMGKTIEQSLMEVLEEEELKSYTRYKAEFEQKRNVELAQCQRLEEAERRREEEKQRRVEQAEAQKKEEEVLKKRVEAQRIATEFLENIENAVFDELDKMGHFHDPIVKEIETIFVPQLLAGVEEQVNERRISNMIVDEMINNAVSAMIAESVQIVRERQEQQAVVERERIAAKLLAEKYEEKRNEFTLAVKAQREDYDFKEQIVGFLDIAMTAPPKDVVEKKDAGDAEEDAEADKDEDEEEPEIPPEIQENIDFVDNLVEQFANDEEPLWKQIQSTMDKIGGETEEKILRIERYLEKCSIKASKKELLAMFEIYKEKEEEEDVGLKQALADCLGAEAFNEEIHSKLLESIKGDEQKEQMEAIEEMVQQKEDIKTFIAGFIKRKEEERVAAEEAARAKEAAENEENDEEEDEEDD